MLPVTATACAAQGLAELCLVVIVMTDAVMTAMITSCTFELLLYSIAKPFIGAETQRFRDNVFMEVLDSLRVLW